MPRATLTFELPEDNAEFRAALAGREALAVLHEIDRVLRYKIKHGEFSPTQHGDLRFVSIKVLKEIRDLIPGELLDI